MSLSMESMMGIHGLLQRSMMFKCTFGGLALEIKNPIVPEKEEDEYAGQLFSWSSCSENYSKYPQNDEDEYSVEISSCVSGNIPKISKDHPKNIPKC